MMNATKYEWPDLTKDDRAIELAKTAMGWNDLTTEQQMDRTRELIQKANDYKAAL